MLDDVLNNIHLSIETRRILDLFRAVNRIPLWVHLNCLEQLGWTPGDYEVGHKIHQNGLKSVKNLDFLIPNTPASISASPSHDVASVSCVAVVYDTDTDSRSSLNSIYDDDDK